MDNIEKEMILSLGRGPKTAWWLAHERRDSIPISHVRGVLGVLESQGFVEPRGVEYLYPQTDRRDGVRRKRGKRLKTWTETRMYYALTEAGRVLLPLDQLKLGVI